jgi:hypothetical protein
MGRCDARVEEKCGKAMMEAKAALFFGGLLLVGTFGLGYWAGGGFTEHDTNARHDPHTHEEQIAATTEIGKVVSGERSGSASRCTIIDPRGDNRNVQVLPYSDLPTRALVFLQSAGARPNTVGCPGDIKWGIVKPFAPNAWIAEKR